MDHTRQVAAECASFHKRETNPQHLWKIWKNIHIHDGGEERFLTVCNYVCRTCDMTVSDIRLTFQSSRGGEFMRSKASTALDSLKAFRMNAELCIIMEQEVCIFLSDSAGESWHNSGRRACTFF